MGDAEKDYRDDLAEEARSMKADALKEGWPHPPDCTCTECIADEITEED